MYLIKFRKIVNILFFFIVLSLCLVFPGSVLSASANTEGPAQFALLDSPEPMRQLNSSSYPSPVEQVRSILQGCYVDQVAEDILSAATIDEILELLGDPYTSYMTAGEYSSFINPSVTGIGIYMEENEAGVGIKSVLSGGPAAQGGLQGGDVITQVREQGTAQWTNLSGLSLDQAGNYIRGEENTVVELTVLRGGELLEYTLTRKKIEIPCLEYSLLDASTGYLELGSFLNNESGPSTDTLFSSALADLEQQGANHYIIDLRDNGGGYVDNAWSIAGHFIGNQLIYQKDYWHHEKGQNVTEPVSATAHNELIDKLIIVLINENSASASEILSGALKDYHCALFLGKNTFGKGCMQTMYYIFNENAPADYLKVTIARYRTPLGNTVDKVGIPPDIPLTTNDPLLAARLLLSASPQDDNKNGLLKLSLSGQEFAINSNEAKKAEYWPVYAEILDSLNTSNLSLGQNNEWTAVNQQALEARWPLYYPGYHLVSNLSKSGNQEIKIRFSAAFDPSSVNSANVELREKDGGESLDLLYEAISDTELKVQPVQALLPGKTYWLLLHPGENAIVSSTGGKLNNGYITVINTPASTSQSVHQLKSFPAKFNNGDPGFFPNRS